MKTLRTVVNYCENNFQVDRLYVFLIFLLTALLIPYIILSMYANPSNDDYDFAVKTIDLGFLDAQISAYNEWNGRHFASLILSIHQLVFPSILLYKIIPIVLFFLSVHSFYYFISKSFLIESRRSKILLSLIISFCFFNDMPSLMQGFYWEPSSIT